MRVPGFRTGKAGIEKGRDPELRGDLDELDSHGFGDRVQLEDDPRHVGPVGHGLRQLEQVGGVLVAVLELVVGKGLLPGFGLG